MQQTTTYKLNLIEADDVFSPEPLSENARKVDAALSSTASALAAETAARKSADTAGTAAWQRAVSDEAAARQKAVTDEAAARQKAVAGETAARKSAVSAEAAARQKAVSDEATARQKAIAAETAARQSAINAEATARKNAVAALERHKFACGTYTGNGTSQTIQLSFTPKAVVIPIANTNGALTGVCLWDKPLNSIKIVTGGFTVSNAGSSLAHSYEYANNSGVRYAYLAFA